MAFNTNGSERVRIHNSGHVMVGQFTSTNPGSGDTVTGCLLDGGNGLIYGSRSNGAAGIFNTNADNEVVRLHRSGNRVGNITVTSSATAYNTSSDYRLKENVVTEWDATTRLKQLKPSRFNFKEDKDTTVDGFLAHEVQSIVPEAVSGEKDAVDKDGNIEAQGIDRSKLVPLLTKALQEAMERIETLEAKVTALEGK